MKFEIDELTLSKIADWIDTLPKTNNVGAIGGRFTYKFTNTNLGQVLKVQDGISGEEKDFTDYDMW